MAPRLCYHPPISVSGYHPELRLVALLVTIIGYSGLPAHLCDGAGQVYSNEDVIGHLLERETLDQTAARLQVPARQVILAKRRLDRGARDGASLSRGAA